MNMNRHIQMLLTSLTILTRFMDYYSPFWGKEQFPWLLNPEVRLRAGLWHSLFWPILSRFVDYYSPIWGPRAIFMVAEAQGVLTCRSSTLAILADSGPFPLLLLTVLCSQSDIYDCWTPRCAYVSFINTHLFDDSDPFHGLLLTVLG